MNLYAAYLDEIESRNGSNVGRGERGKNSRKSSVTENQCGAGERIHEYSWPRPAGSRCRPRRTTRSSLDRRSCAARCWPPSRSRTPPSRRRPAAHRDRCASSCRGGPPQRTDGNRCNLGP